MSELEWHSVCSPGRITPDRGVAALVDTGGEQPLMVALFRLSSAGPEFPEEWLAIDHVDPVADAPVMARGLVGSVGEVPTVASPIGKRRYDLRTGLALDGSDPALRVWPVRIIDFEVQIGVPVLELVEKAVV